MDPVKDWIEFDGSDRNVLLLKLVKYVFWKDSCSFEAIMDTIDDDLKALKHGLCELNEFENSDSRIPSNFETSFSLYRPK